ncbi:sialate O-acetylesterase [Mitsuaria sp. BK045]|uniref:sialate O-acetylesterase n=1 Tax=unclassified Roseateles TaxID=2626991 RepID=UPI00160FB72B|nr:MULTISPECIES: sialate O-acetylesterase [unclassified Roseateles]MBB3293390.1 sialate O-acetylesterase [Mitsuaria sp. BK041]MBB3362607.1 sialate O-acetylesterase [Mitsuaria sp. BK045]
MKQTVLPLILALLAATAQAEVRLSEVFGEHMVLQRDRPLRLWGQATPGQSLTVTLGGREATTRVGADGRWRVQLDPLPAGGPHRLQVTGDQTVTLEDVLIGDVWLLGGQSNMEWPLAQTDTGPQEVASPQDARLRQLRVPLRASVRPEAEIAPAPWVVAEPGRVGEFSAVGYHFARRMQAVQGIPIGLIATAWGGSMLETWMSRGAALRDPDLAPTVRALPADNAAFSAVLGQQLQRRVAAWQPGLSLAGVDASGWNAAGDIDAKWPTLQAPGAWEGQGLADVDGVVWMRKRVELTAAQAAGAAELHLAKVDDCDEVWINGQRIGGQCGWELSRRYAVPVGTLRAGANWIAVRVTDTGGGGGIYGDAADLRLDTAAGPVTLVGAWRARVEKLAPAAGPVANNAPALGHNGLIAPLQGLSVRGVLWYQGEENAGRAAAYADGFKRLIQDWRQQFGDPDLPFLFVQLAAWRPLADNRPDGNGFAELRGSQAAALALPHTGMATAIDIGDAIDIHPRNKRTVGERLAAVAMHELGLRDAPATGPRLIGGQARGAEFELRFDRTEGGLRTTRTGEPLRGFYLAGADRRWAPAQARFDGDRIVLRSDAVAAPVAARYAWVDNPGEANIVGGDGLPLPPLRTDDWPLASAGRRYGR